MNEEEKKALKLIEDSLNKKCNGLECKVVKNNIDLRLENIRLKRQIDLMAEYLASIDFDEHCVEVPGICIGCPKEDDLDGYMQCIKQYFERKVNES